MEEKSAEDNKIDDYWRCLDDDDREWSLMEERNSRENLNIATMFESAMHGLIHNRMGRFHLEGIHTYDILRNPNYWQAFQYISASIPDRQSYIKDGDADQTNNCDQSDFVRRILNLSLLSPDELKSLQDLNFNLRAVKSRDFVPAEIKIKPTKIMKTKEVEKLEVAGKVLKSGAKAVKK